MLTNGLPDRPQLATAFPGLNDTSCETVQLAFNNVLMVERFGLNLLEKRSIDVVANLLLAAAKLPVMESQYRHLVVDFFGSDEPTIAILPLRGCQVLETMDGSYNRCYHLQPSQSDPFLLKKFGYKDYAADELYLWRAVYGLSADQVVLVANVVLLMPWFDEPIEKLQQNKDFVAKVKKLCSEMEEAGKLVGENWIHGDIRWPNIGCVVIENEEDEYLPVMLDLSSLRLDETKASFCQIGGRGKLKSFNITHAGQMLQNGLSPFFPV